MRPVGSPALPASGESADRERSLESTFLVFTAAARELEEAYEKLRRKGEEIDRELRHRNRELRIKVKELDDLSCYLEGLLEALPTGVIAVGRDGRIDLANRAAESILGVSRSEILGRAREDFGAPQGPLLPEPGSGTDEDGAIEEREIVDFRGERKKVEGRLIVLRNQEGEIQGRVEILDDRTEVVRLRERVHRLDRLASLGEMAAGMAHEIRNPLYGSAGFADLLEKELEKREEGRRLVPWVEKIRRGIQRVDAIIDSVLSFSRPRDWAEARVDLVHVLEEAVDTVTGSPRVAATHRVERRLPDGRILLDIDAARMGRVFENLLLNAVESMPGGGAVDVELREECAPGEESGTPGEDGGTIVITVGDRGAGVDASALERIFDPFFTTKDSGAGLGLFFSQRILDVYEGSLEIANREGGGALATVRLPRRRRRERTGNPRVAGGDPRAARSDRP